ncbi:hypothetical protein HYH03_007620 [Edaphochlamys debaryana]|uniref:Methyltransferase domain-containing protein n=1 Tax=Edaphochlamys debaryana TaxID=47281 RepID=A0A835Y1R4_9CHLO|nr:hypothetical protein HYH03_007620 [Edaphochlamys debaryana]|eukprot:KAG2494265.1 hypothetical protein HYH03_007620 [Edaphochlamys debaryana]
MLSNPSISSALALTLLALLALPSISASVNSKGWLPTRHATENTRWAREAVANLSQWRSSLFERIQRYVVLKDNEVKLPGRERYEPFQPFISCPPNRPLQRVGPEGDGGKWLCGMDRLSSPCTVISVGSNNDYRFEEAALADTNCQVVTLDCTVKEGKSLETRHRFFKKCLASRTLAPERADFMTYAQLTSQLGLPKGAAPLLKMDAENYEFPVFAEWAENTPHLPEQIAVEIHYLSYGNKLSAGFPLFGRLPGFTVTDLALFFGHMANLGYGIVSKEDNPECPDCSEYTLYRVESSRFEKPRSSWFG